MKSCANQHLRQTKPSQTKIKKNQKSKSKKKSKKKIKKEKEKEFFFSVILDKMCIFCLYPIPDSQQCVKRGSCRHPFCPGYYFIFVLIGPRAHLCQDSSLSLEPISLCCLFILLSLRVIFMLFN